MSFLLMTDSYENYLYFNVNELNKRRDLPETFWRPRFVRFLAFLESFDEIVITF